MLFPINRKQADTTAFDRRVIVPQGKIESGIHLFSLHQEAGFMEELISNPKYIRTLIFRKPCPTNRHYIIHHNRYKENDSFSGTKMNIIETMNTPCAVTLISCFLFEVHARLLSGRVIDEEGGGIKGTPVSLVIAGLSDISGKESEI